MQNNKNNWIKLLKPANLLFERQVLFIKKLNFFIPILLLFVLITTFITPTIKSSERIANNVFRLHILANSDEDYDQTLKLKVKDSVINSTKDIFINCDSLDDAIICAKDNVNYIANIATQTIYKNGYNYKVNVYVDKEYFNTRYYDNFTMPAGIYNSLKIVIGEGNGHNWWCVMYPTVCLSGCIDDFDDTLNEEDKRLILSNKYSLKFKTVEIYEKIKKTLIKKD